MCNRVCMYVRARVYMGVCTNLQRIASAPVYTYLHAAADLNIITFILSQQQIFRVSYLNHNEYLGEDVTNFILHKISTKLSTYSMQITTTVNPME